ncbi:hypothetical protein IWX47DRAFT_509173 [Phyllosticta citricarpa]|uniref:Uncharacterized protein n=1 Tax=Phyllosticta citricarpa TaxID=55181 RepID=A0ABR1LIQ0_9PEZI
MCSTIGHVCVVRGLKQSIHPSISSIDDGRLTMAVSTASGWGRSGQGLQALRHRVLSSIVLCCFFSTSSFTTTSQTPTRIINPTPTRTKRKRISPPPPSTLPLTTKSPKEPNKETRTTPIPVPPNFKETLALSPQPSGAQDPAPRPKPKKKKSQSIKVWRCITAIVIIAFRGVGAACLLLISFTNSRCGRWVGEHCHDV